MATINGTSGNDSLIGTAGDDLIKPLTGLDTVDGGGGLDLLYEDYGTIQTGDGRWYLTATNAAGTSGMLGASQPLAGLAVTFSNVESIELHAQGAFYMDGKLLTGSGTVVADGTGSMDELHLNLIAFSAGVQVSVTGTTATTPHGTFTGFERSEFTLSQGNDTVVAGDAQVILLGQGGDDRLTGGAASDSIYGHDGNDTIDGGGGDDLLFGGDGQDAINGGDGSDFLHSSIDLLAETTITRDVLNGGAGDDWMWAGYGDSVDGGGGQNDTIALDFHLATAGQTINLAAAFSGGTSTIGTTAITNVEAYYAIYATSGNDTITIGNGGYNGIHTVSSDLQQGIRGLDGDDKISGGANADLVFGGSGNDLIGGYGGDDVIYGDDGNDTITGGSGNDSINGGGGVDALYGEDGNDTLAASAGTDLLVGGAGDDQLYLAEGVTNGANNKASGGTGNDSYYNVDNGDLIFENTGEGTDTVFANTSHYLEANVENLVLGSSAGNIFGVGNDLANAIAGNTDGNLLIGGLGDDTIHGGDGNDAIFGQAGHNQLFGDGGIDYIVAGDGGDTVDGGDGADALYGGVGNDTLIGGSDFSTDILVGGGGDDVLHGDSGLGDYDRMDGGAGNDTYYVDTGNDLTFEAANGGTDTVIANVAGANNGVYLYANVENLTLAGTTTFGVGNELDNRIAGNAAVNLLLGGGGNDTLNGSGGNDVLFGQAGNDIFVFERGTGGDVIGDFTQGQDKIEIVGIYGTFAQVQAHFVQVGTNGAIDLGDGDIIVLHNVTMASLTAGDFVLL